MPDSAVILAGGLSKRYGKNKILETFNGKTLIDYSIEFCVSNNIKQKVVVYYDPDIRQHLETKYKKSVQDGSLIVVQRPCSPEGTGMSLLTGAAYAGDRFIVLFGDNYYKGNLIDNTKSNIATSIYKLHDEKNLRFAAVKHNTIVEKPHNITAGPFFTGYMIFNKKDVLRKPITLSKRGEVEITDLFNACQERSIIPLDIFWEEITYSEDYGKMSDYINENEI